MNKYSIDDYERTETISNYQEETGLTPEADLTYAILYLAQHNQIINNWESAGSVCYYLNAWFFGYRPRGYWHRNRQQANLSGGEPDSRVAYYGVRPAVRLKFPFPKQT